MWLNICGCTVRVVVEQLWGTVRVVGEQLRVDLKGYG